MNIPDLSTLPGTFIASVPAMLGYFPQEALILLSFNKDCSSMPMTHISLDDSDNLPSVMCILADQKVEYAWAFIITHTSRQEAQRLCNRLNSVMKKYDESCDRRVPIVAWWSTQEIVTGGSLACLDFDAQWCEKYMGKKETADFSLFHDTKIEDVAATPAMRFLAASGVLPELDSESIFSRWDKKNLLYSDKEISAWQEHIIARSAECTVNAKIAESLSIQCSLSKEKYSDVYQAIRRIMQSLAWIHEKHNDISIIWNSKDSLEAGAIVCSDSFLRDLMFAFMPAAKGNSWDVLFSAVATTFTGVIKSNALCLLSVYYYRPSLRHLVIPSLRAALIATPSHTCAELLIEGVIRGLGGEMFRKIMEKSAAMHEQFYW